MPKVPPNRGMLSMKTERKCSHTMHKVEDYCTLLGMKSQGNYCFEIVSEDKGSFVILDIKTQQNSPSYYAQG